VLASRGKKLQRGFIKTELITVAKNHPINQCFLIMIGRLGW